MCSTLAAMRREPALTADPELAREVLEEIETAQRDQAEFAQRIGLSKVWAEAKAESRSVGETSDYSRLRPGDAAGAAHFAVDGPATSINIELKPVEHITAAGRIAASLCLAGVVGLFILGLRRGTWAMILKKRPCAVSVAAGLAWWWWLRPSALGLAVAVLIIVCRLVHRWQMPQTKSGSTGS